MCCHILSSTSVKISSLLCNSLVICRFADGSVAALEEFIKEAVTAPTGKDTGANSTHARAIDCVDARSLPYEDFVAKYMQPNHPVLIQASLVKF